MPIYLDTAASTAIDPQVLAVMLQALGADGAFANPSSGEHEPGRHAAEAVEGARARVAKELGCGHDKIVFTSGATESINLALRGVALAHRAQGRHIVTSQIEHKATLACCAALERDGFDVTYVPPDASGQVDPDAVAAALRDDTLLVSVMHTNNETGVIQPIEAIAEVAARQGVLLHVDAAQAAGKFRLHLEEQQIDLLSLSAHKFHGPKGAGCLAIRDRSRLRLQPLVYGGGQEFGLRPGTQPTHQILGLAAALELAARRRASDLALVAQLKAHFMGCISAELPVRLQGNAARVSPYIANLSIVGIRSDALINQTSAEIAIASGAACSAGTYEPSPVLRAMGVEGDTLYGAVRVSFDRNHTTADMDRAAAAIVAAVRRIRELDA